MTADPTAVTAPLYRAVDQYSGDVASLQCACVALAAENTRLRAELAEAEAGLAEVLAKLDRITGEQEQTRLAWEPNK